MKENLILHVIREVTKLKGPVRFTEIARLAKRTPLEVVETLNRNQDLLSIVNGKVFGEKVQWKLQCLWYQEGRYYVPDVDNYRSDKVLRFKGHDDLRKELERTVCYGGFGDSHIVTRVEDTSENRARLEAAGCVDVKSIKLDDRLWTE